MRIPVTFVAVALEFLVFGGLTVLSYRALRRRAQAKQSIGLPGFGVSVGGLLLVLSLITTLVVAGVSVGAFTVGLSALSSGILWWGRSVHSRRSPAPVTAPAPIVPEGDAQTAGWGRPVPAPGAQQSPTPA